MGVSNLKRHYKNKHSPKTTNSGVSREKVDSHRCNERGKTFLRKEYLKSHQKTIHGPSTTRYLCPVCNHMFTRAYNVRCHLKLLHRDELIHNTDLINQINTEIINSANTPTTHSKGKTKPIKRELRKCELCGIFVRGTGNLNRHIKNKHSPKILIRREESTPYERFQIEFNECHSLFPLQINFIDLKYKLLLQVKDNTRKFNVNSNCNRMQPSI